MALATILTKKTNAIGTIELDVIITEGASASATITKNPVENGADINDHIIIEPMTFNIRGLVSDVSSSVLDIGQSIASASAESASKSEQAWNDLLDLQATREPFTLIQNLKTYDNVVIQSLSYNQDKDTGNALDFTATLVEINLVGVGAPPVTEYEDQTTEDKAIPATNGGLKQVA